MLAWYYLHPEDGRVGPYPAEELRRGFRDGRIRPDTLVWRDGLSGWVPLARVAAELGLDAVAPGVPPPLPPTPPPPAGRPRPAAPQPRISGCLIALLAGAGLAIPLAGILAAIAVPAYGDYTVRARVAATVADAAPLKAAISEHLARHGACPGDDSAGMAPVLRQLDRSPHVGAVRVGTGPGGHCAFEITVRVPAARADGKTVLFQARHAGDRLEWDCGGGDLPARFRPRQCRPNQKDPT